MRTLTLTLSLFLVAASGASDASTQVPLCPGLSVVTAVNQPNGDYESIKTVESVGETTRLKYSAEAPFRDLFSTSTTEEVKRTTVYRSMPAADLTSGTLYQQIFIEGSDETIPGTTSIGTSAGVLADLKSKGTAPLSISLAHGAVPLTSNRDVRPNAYDFFTAGTLERIGIVKVPMLVNDRRVELDAVEARGVFGGEKADFLFLDDDSNPITLKMRLGIDAIPPMVPELAETCAAMRKANVDARALEMSCRTTPGTRSVLAVIKISYRCTGPAFAAGGGGGQAPKLPSADLGASAAALERSLQESGKADIYSIYFSFNSDEIREESEQTLKDIGALMRKHPDWKLSIHGHTDNIASDAYNLDLSRRRAAAVTKALTARHSVDGGRLSSVGHGESMPKDTNETLEGRALNRRVELIRM